MRKKILSVTALLLFMGCSAIPATSGENPSNAPVTEALFTETESSTEGTESLITETETETETEEDTLPENLFPEPKKGIYVSAWVAGTRDRMNEMIAGIDATELNTIVIDVKDDEGRIVWDVDSPLIRETGAVRTLIGDMPGLVQELHDHGIYVIGRCVCFRDPFISTVKPEWTIHNDDGSIYRDEKDFSWIDPSCTEAHDYLMEVADACKAAGFDEVQFDYVRYPTKATESMVGVDGAGRKQKITDFAVFSKEHFKQLGIPFSMDVFGIVIHAEYDRNIVGQDYGALSFETDCLSPMVYPSHYADGTYNIDFPDLYPYEVIYSSMTESRELLEKATVSGNQGAQATVRPWLQGFTANYLSHYRDYGAEEIRLQIQAVYDAGYEEWLIWDPSDHYPWEAFVNTRGTVSENTAVQPEEAPGTPSQTSAEDTGSDSESPASE